MRSKQIMGYFILAAAAGFAIHKINTSGLLEHLERDWFSFLGVLLLVLVLALAIFKVLRD